MSPAASELVEQHYVEALRVGRRFVFPDDPGLGESVALEAVCLAAQKWVDRGVTGMFVGWMRVYVKRRLIEEYRSRYGRQGQNPPALPLDADRLATFDHAGAVALVVDLQTAGLNERERWMIAAWIDGWRKFEIAKVWTVSPGRVSQIMQEVGAKVGGSAPGDSRYSR